MKTQDGSAVEVADVNVVNALRYYIEHEADFTPRDRIAIAHRAIAALKAARAEERERCAKVAEQLRSLSGGGTAWHDKVCDQHAQTIAAAIRSQPPATDPDSEMPNCCLGLSRKDCEHCIL
jgi:hypothetical protein